MNESETPAAKPPAEDPVTVRVLEVVREALPDAVVEAVTTGRHPSVTLKVERLREVCRLLKEDDALRYDCCHLISGIDYPDEETIEVVYHLVSYERRPRDADEYRGRAEKNDPWVALRVRVARDVPEVPSVADIWTGADWHERETYDLVGVVFTGRDSLRRILLPADWPGHPLRKDWEYPVSYHGVPIVPPEAQS